jgi:FdhD protein
MPSIAKFSAVRFQNAQKHEVEDVLTTEGPLQILVNDTAFSMTMRTPGRDMELVRGLLYSEDVCDAQAKSYKSMTSCIDENGDISAVNVLVNPSELGKGYQSERSLMSVSSCGICGKKDTEGMLPEGTPLQCDVQLSSEDLGSYFDQMANLQDTFLKSGGSHAASAFSLKGEMLSLQEDIGRHNAVDKVVGDLLLNNQLDQASVLLVSGRVSYEIISKAFRANFPFLAAVSAPSSMAVEFAEQLGICLLAFCREGKCTVYTYPQRVRV